MWGYSSYHIQHCSVHANNIITGIMGENSISICEWGCVFEVLDCDPIHIGPSVCLNGGNCSIYGYCNCPFGYTGQFCETSKFGLVVVLVDVVIPSLCLHIS